MCKKFEEKYGLAFTLLADPERKVIEAYDVWKEKKNYGKVSMGVVRTTYLIDENGIIIRANDKYAVIIVGTPKWSQRLDEAVASPIDFDDNLMYTLHFYANTHKDELREIYRDAIAHKLPVFVSEFGTCSADGNGGHNPEESQTWLDMLDENDTSYMMWNISNRDETSASFVPECENYTGPYEEKDMREPAVWYVKRLTGK